MAVENTYLQWIIGGTQVKPNLLNQDGCHIVSTFSQEIADPSSQAQIKFKKKKSFRNVLDTQREAIRNFDESLNMDFVVFDHL